MQGAAASIVRSVGVLEDWIDGVIPKFKINRESLFTETTNASLG
jgi:hypothetical protein